MAQQAFRLASNVAGDFFVDSSCIDCDACRRIAPSAFARRGEQSAVVRQPIDADEVLDAERALLACPTASIGTVSRHDLRRAIATFPSRVDGNVYFCGFTAESSFGASSWLIVRERGNVLVDSPRFNLPLARNIERLGGVSIMLLTHIDDVADHRKFRDHFGCRRVIHYDDARGIGPLEVEQRGAGPLQIDDEILMIPTPGHTRGHAVYLYRDEVLFTGDHLAWDPVRRRLTAFRDACWYSWEDQIRSMEKLQRYDFRRILPGHGHAIELEKHAMRESLAVLIAWMRTTSDRARRAQGSK